MIAGVRGLVATVEDDAVIVDLHGFLVRVLAPGSTLSTLPAAGGEVDLKTHLVVREDSLTLYGFSTLAELQLFELLITVNGVGPRVAMNLLSFSDPAGLYQAIADEDMTMLSRAPGIGKVTAGRIILDLKRKLPEDFSPSLGGQPDDRDQEAISALEALGYTAGEARSALGSVENRAHLTVEERVVGALRMMDDNT
ncbi:MAG: Holliday junction branch migration protein RuvA [Thermomicrobiales bacterium]